MQKWGEERIFPHPNIYYRTSKKTDEAKGLIPFIGLFYFS